MSGGGPQLRAVLDACVLYPVVTRGLLLAAARAGHFQPVWSPRLIGEWLARAAKDGPLQTLAAQEAAAGMAADWPEAMVTPLPLDIDLPDADDVHVLAACVTGRAGHLITRNLRDFPARTLARFGVMRADPDALLAAFAREDAAAIRAGALALLPGVELRATLKRAGLPRLARCLRDGGG